VQADKDAPVAGRRSHMDFRCAWLSCCQRLLQHTRVDAGRWTDGRTDRWTYKWTDRWTDRGTDGPTERQAGRWVGGGEGDCPSRHTVPPRPPRLLRASDMGRWKGCTDRTRSPEVDAQRQRSQHVTQLLGRQVGGGHAHLAAAAAEAGLHIAGQIDRRARVPQPQGHLSRASSCGCWGLQVRVNGSGVGDSLGDPAQRGF
jgi:hypothetical protein